jgi:hypothetical protein
VEARVEAPKKDEKKTKKEKSNGEIFAKPII